MRSRLSLPRSEMNRRIRRERRRLGRFVAFAEMLANLSPVPLIARPEPRKSIRPKADKWGTKCRR